MLGMIISFLLGTTIYVSNAPTVFAAEPSAPVEQMSTTTLQVMARQIATEHNLDVDLFLKVIGCESQWNQFAEGDYPDGHGGWVPKALAPAGAEPTTFGIAQLHFPTRDWKIATSTAYDPYISMEMMAKSWQKGEASRWSCWRTNFGK